MNHVEEVIFSLTKRIDKLEEKVQFLVRDEEDRLVSDLPNRRFLDNGDGTITDTETNLMWQKRGSEVALSWMEAKSSIKNGHYSFGHNDWRLPTIKELISIVDYGRHNPAIDPVFECEPSVYWSSTTLAYYPYDARLVHFYDGFVSYSNKTGYYYVRAVRNI